MAAIRTAAAAREFLTANTFFGSLSGDLVDCLIERGIVRRLRTGHVFFEQGDAGDSLWIILSGSVKIVTIVGDARPVVLNFLGRGDIFGEIAALDGGMRSGTAIALEPTDVFILYRRDLLSVLRQSSDALLEILCLFCEKLRVTSAIVENSARAMQGRFANGLQRLAELHGRSTRRGIEIDLAAKQGELGEYFGLSRANTSRLINLFEREGILESDGRTLIIKNESGLSKMVDQ